ncbi:MAG: class II aldolase/adducin family protein [Candidatus Latescibacteria bacterium]|nr:class II aldolase/adducin family protein [Candidatus Latescibacterota bacterium]
MLLEALRKEVCRVNWELPKRGLVTMTSGNASGRDRDTGYVVIKPSGMEYDAMQPEDMGIVDSDGNLVEGSWRPSVDLSEHLYLYRHRPELGGIIHTHSNYATSFAALGRGIPVYLTAIADEFGAEIPCSRFASNEGDQIGKALVEAMGRGPAVLLKNHGVWTFGPTPVAALKAAVMVEDVAKTCHLALLLGTPDSLPPEEAAKWWDRYHGRYGQQEA